MISVIIPAYNEEKRILPTLDKILAVMENQEEDYELLVVNDGSRDQTEKVVLSLDHNKIKLLSYEQNRGKGGAVKYGVEHARGEYIVFTDADLPYPPENILSACEKLSQTAEVVLGKRVLAENGNAYPWYRKCMSAIFGLFVRLTLKVKEKDTQCGFKAFRKEAAQAIFQRMTLSGWGFDVEMIYLAEKLGFQIERMEVELFHDNINSKIKVLGDTRKMIKEILKVKKNIKKGIYNR